MHRHNEPAQRQPGPITEGDGLTVAGRVLSWAPMQQGQASSGRAQWQSDAKGCLLIRSRPLAWGLGVGLLVTGLLALALGLPLAWSKAVYSLVLLALIGALLLGAAGLYVLNPRLLCFDRSRGEYRSGQRQFFALPGDKPLRGELRNISALQLLVQQLSTAEAQFACYELNLVLADGERVHVMDHLSRADIEAAAAELSRYLGVPILRAPELG